MEDKSLQIASGSETDITSRIRICYNRQQLERLHSVICHRYHALERNTLISDIN